jgi:acyl-CoA thioesterase-1
VPGTKLKITCLFLTISSYAAEKIRVACIGDSITAGADIRVRNMHYPNQLQKLLGDKYDVKNFGVSGRTLLKKGDHPIWREKKYKNAIAFNPNIVVIKLGTNDTKPQNWKYKDEFKSDLIAMVKQFQALGAKPKVFLCKPVPVYQTKWGISEKVVTEGVIPIVEAVAKEMNLKVIDLYTALSGKEKLFPDKIHPNGKGATIMAETIKKAIQ